MPADAKPRWITVRKPFDYHWPGRSAVTTFRDTDLGEHYVKAEVADFAVDGGYATEGKVDGSARSRKSTGKRVSSRRRSKDESPAEAADARAKPPVDHAGDADADRPAGGAALAPDAE